MREGLSMRQRAKHEGAKHETERAKHEQGESQA